MISNHKITRPLSQKLGLIFLASGVGLFVLSYLVNSEVFVFIGLGLTFWGALFLLVTPTLYVEGKIVADTLTPSYTTTERVIKDLDYKGKGFHIPPYPEKTNVPDHLRGLKEMVVFVPKDIHTFKPPSLQELAEGKFLLKNPEGILLTPPGLGLLGSIERKSDVDFTKTPLRDVCKIMPKYLLGDYALAKEINLTLKEPAVHLKMNGSIYRSLYTENKNTQSLSLLGCPIISSIACALAKSTGKPIAIENLNIASDGLTVEAQLTIVEGTQP